MSKAALDALYMTSFGVWGTLADIIQILIQDAVFAWHIRYSNLSAKDCQSNPCSRFWLYFSDLDKLYSIYSNMMVLKWPLP